MYFCWFCNRKALKTLERWHTRQEETLSLRSWRELNKGTILRVACRIKGTSNRWWVSQELATAGTHSHHKAIGLVEEAVFPDQVRIHLCERDTATEPKPEGREEITWSSPPVHLFSSVSLVAKPLQKPEWAQCHHLWEQEPPLSRA